MTPTHSGTPDGSSGGSAGGPSGGAGGRLPTDAGAAKTALRDQLLTARGRIPVAELGSAAQAIAEHVIGLPEVRRAATVSCYVSVGPEPGTAPLLEAWTRPETPTRKRVLLPVVLPGFDLDWAPYAGGPHDLAPARYGLLEPTSPTLGVDAIAGADVVVVPGLAVDRAGIRMGRGGGCYDRALARVPAGTPVIVLLHDGEVLDRVPAEPHDRPVTAAVTPSGVFRF